MSDSPSVWHRLRDWLGGPRVSSPAALGERTQGLPTSSNGASSLHARWLHEPADVVAVEVDLTIDETPGSDHLRFFALQASFAERGRAHGAGHLGLQWISWHPGNTAANWGGYHHAGSGQSGELPGTSSALPSAVGNANTRDYEWSAGTPYRLRIARGDDGWAGSVTDLGTDTTTVIRELVCRGDRLTSVVMWSEIFAPCEGPGVTVRWGRPRWQVATGEFVPVGQVQLSYQRVEDGGCSNSSTTLEGDAVVQRTAVPRKHPHGTVLRIG